MKHFSIICLLLLPLQVIANTYYASFENAGQVSEYGNDLVLYFDNDKVWGELRIYSNMYDNVYVTLYGEGTADDTTLSLGGIASSEGTTYEVDNLTLEFQEPYNQTLTITGSLLAKPFTLSKKAGVIEQMKHLGPLDTKTKLIDRVNQFINKQSKVAAAIVAQLPKANIGNTRELRIFDQDYRLINQNLQQLFKRLSRQPDSTLFKRFKADPAFAVIYGFKQTGLLPEAKQVYSYDDKQGKVGYTWKTCPADFNIEDDEDGLCETFHFYHAKHLEIKPLLVEVEAHKTCLDDSCQHDYYQLYLSRGIAFGWKVTSHRIAQRCETYRGGGSPPCP